MFERFGRQARVAIVLAQEDARELRSPVIDVQHVLLGLLGHAEPALRTLLAESGVTRDAVAAALAERGRGEPLGEEDAEALRSIGIDLDAVRASLEAGFGADALAQAAPEPRGRFARWSGGHIPFTRDAKKTLELALREALARKDRSIESGHLLLGILRGANEVTTELLGGPAARDALRPRIHALLDRAA
ncbi:Clp protease N-terminal domain-containing protein [Nocardia asteroides]|uniref:Clp protease N-terminal domain-containing protein n=1 Tax=Nocardia asteroides TaxID=1824 RepID=UPI001E5C009C|nr:Clp protease N-terminal domain-containing protein [Nocardia asteroides]UGT64640.1 Clp protease [Nocardia asteroides]